ncbi:uncharacterized protein [Watersipora subatra]|uniref:uncharacterized protein n=1 Tax=Watersipora subatra TaxID=2589382 RepID=UPI00355B8B60
MPRELKEERPLLEKQRSEMAKRGVHNVGYQMDIDDVVIEKEYWEDDFDEEKILFADGKKRGTSLIWNDFAILTIEYMQWFAVIQSLALRWPWPESWIRNMSWIFAFNFDVWEIAKVYTNVTYKSVQEFSSDSSLMPFAYWNFLLAFLILLVLLVIAYPIANAVLSKRDDPYLVVKLSNLQRVYVIICQLLALPIGVALGKVFHCVPDSKGEILIMYIDNTQKCFGNLQWAYAAVAIGVALAFYILFPVWLIRRTKLELIFSHAAGHEAYLQLKETEYVQGLDVVYIVSGFHIFSSFKLKAAHFRAAMHLLKLSACIIYAAVFNYNLMQAMALCFLILIYFIAFAIQRPFRVKLFNGMLALNTFFLVLNLVTGVVGTSFDAYSLRSVWFTPQYTLSVLIAINGFWFFITICILVYLLLHQFNVFSKPIWPTLTSEGVDKLEEVTKKFMKGVLRARHIIEKSMSLPPLFAPAHELSRQIQIINAYCREAELLDDPLQDTLWHLLDELIEVHAQIAPRSLFSESVKDSIRTTAADLMRIMPMFVKRLAQREYDMLLMTPMKRRILLKLYCMGMFLNGRAKKVEKSKVNEAALSKVWHDGRVGTRQTLDYIGILQPEREIGPRAGDVYTAEPLHAVEYMEIEDDTLTDDESLDIDAMVAGIPNRSALASRATMSPARPSTAASRRTTDMHPVADVAPFTDATPGPDRLSSNLVDTSVEIEKASSA